MQRAARVLALSTLLLACGPSDEKLAFRRGGAPFDMAALERLCGARRPTPVEKNLVREGEESWTFSRSPAYPAAYPSFACKITVDTRDQALIAVDIDATAATMAELLPFRERILDMLLPLVPERLAPRVAMMAGSPTAVHLDALGATVAGGFRVHRADLVVWDFMVVAPRAP